MGNQEAGDTRYLVSRGYAHVVGNPRSIGKSEENSSYPLGYFKVETDYYDLIEWIASQPWCDGNIGMIGMSAFAMAQYQAAAQQPPHLKCIAPYDSATDIYRDFCYRGGLFWHWFMAAGCLTPSASVYGQGLLRVSFHQPIYL
jgi:putative CocE/NonD family hydrolase